MGATLLLIKLVWKQTAATVNPQYIANEFQYVYLLPLEKDLEEYEVSGDEIARLVEIDLQDGLDLFFNEKSNILSREKYLDGGKYIIQERNLTKSNFMECYQIIDEFYKRMLNAVKRFCDGENPKFIMW